MKKIISIIFVLLILLSVFCVNAFASVNTIIDDSADLFSDSEESEISESVLQFSDETGYSAIVLTTDSAMGKTSQQYADDYFDNLIISEGWEEKGILFLIDMDNREVCISTMGDCISVYSDYIDSIIDSGYDDLVNGNYSDCIIMMVSSSLKFAMSNSDDYYIGDYDDTFCGDYSVIDGEIVYDDYQTKGSFDFSNILICIIIAVVIGVVSVIAVRSSYKNMGKGDEFDADDVILNLTGSNDTVISRNVITTRVPRNNNNHRSGGGVSHRSSGGFSHGGGSRKF